MKILITAFIFLLIFNSCQSTSNIRKGEIEDPCSDSLYIELKKIEMADMNNNELEYFKQKEKECNEFKNMPSFTNVTLVAFIIAGVLVIAIWILENYSPH